MVVIEGVAPALPGDDLGSAIAEPLSVVAALSPGLRTRVAAVVVGADGTLTLRARPGGVVRLCDTTRLDEKVRVLGTFFAQVDDTDLATVDVCDAPSLYVTRPS